MTSLKNVDDYLATVPKEVKPKLEQLRQAIKDACPQAQEKISYGMPYYGYKGRLVYFRLSSKHIGVYIPTPVLAEHAAELKDYSTSDATLRIPLDQELPVALIQKLVKARVRINDDLEKKV